MPSIIRIKRSLTSGDPNVLAAGELAYSAADPTLVSGGGRLYIGIGAETNGDASNHFVVGGKYFTDMMDHTRGNLTADSAILVDSNKKINELYVDNLLFDNNTISSTNISGDVIINPNGDGRTIAHNLFINDGSTIRAISEFVEDISGVLLQGTSGVISVDYDDGAGTTTFDLVETGVTDGSYGALNKIPTFTVDADGRITSAAEITTATDLSVASDSGTANVDLLNETLSIVGLNSISTSITSNTVTVNIENATTSQRGVASFDSSDFTVSGGAVSAKDITLGATVLSLGTTVTEIEGLQSLDIDNINIDGNTISATNTDGGISLLTNGIGHVSVNDARIQDVEDPVGPKDAANKRYVDELAQGLQALPEAASATTANLDATYANGGLSATLTANTNGTFPTIDGYDLQVGENILVKDQTNKHENGSYVLTDAGDASNPWVLTRCDFCNETDEIAGAFEFITNGDQYANTGWVATVPSDFVLGSTDPTSDPNGFVNRGDIVWVQFSGAGTFTAGDGLVLDGTTFDINLAANSGLEISSDELQLNSSVAGAGLVFTNGVIDIVGSSDRIDVSSNSIDIASTYVGQESITTLGTISTGIWQGTVISPVYGGTGANNGSNTLNLEGNLSTTGSSSINLTSTSTTDVTLPTTGTLATLAEPETIENKSIESSTIGSVSPTTGAFTSLNASGTVSFTNTTDSSSVSSGSLVVDGGVGVAKKIFVGMNVEGSGADTGEINGFTIDGGTY